MLMLMLMLHLVRLWKHNPGLCALILVPQAHRLVPTRVGLLGTNSRPHNCAMRRLPLPNRCIHCTQTEVRSISRDSRTVVRRERQASHSPLPGRRATTPLSKGPHVLP